MALTTLPGIDNTWGMIDNNGDRLLQMEEEAEGVELFRTPGSHLVIDDARDQAEASGWIPSQDLPEGAPPLERARAKRRDLRQTMDVLEDVVSRPATTDSWNDTVRDALEDVKRALIDHIHEVEAPGGLLAEVIDDAPRLSNRVQELEGEHGVLIAAVDRALESTASSGRDDPAALRRRVVSLLGRLTNHRQQGADLVYEAYNVDIAAAD